MTKLTGQAIEADPWNAIRFDLQDADHVDLRLAALKAAMHCVEEAHDQMVAARAGELIPEGWQPGHCDVHECYEGDWAQAMERLKWILLHTDWTEL
jgi:hypothetical protein